jgi:hypothetical protein
MELYQPSKLSTVKGTLPMNTIRVPASLDLVERARLGLNGLTGSVNPELDFEPYFLTFFGAKPAYMVHWSSLISGVLPKYVEALALLRCMSGSTEHMDIDQGLIQSVRSNISEDGLIYDRKRPDRPWNVGIGYGKKSWDEDYSCLAGDGRLLCGMEFYAQMTGDDFWHRQMKRTAERMLDLAIVRKETAYYPNVGCGNDFSYQRQSGWIHTNEPASAQEGAEGATTFYLGLPIRGFIRWYQRSGDERFLELSRKFTNFITSPKYWGAVVEQEPAYGATRAHFWGHFHGTLAALRSILEYALAANDARLKQFVRDGYEWAWHHLCPRLGIDTALEGCTTADLVALGIQLSSAGVGDFWDYVDTLIWNSLSEAQVTNLEAIQKLSEVSPERPEGAPWGAAQDFRFVNSYIRQPFPGQETTSNVLKRAIGGFSFNLVNGRFQSPLEMACCTANGNQGFYYAWNAVLKTSGETATVNLLFNRFSPWLDVISYLPYEGKVVVHNKKARNIQVRIPGWVSPGEVRCKVNDITIEPSWCGRCAGFLDIPVQAALTVEFPIHQETVSLPIPFMNARQYRGVARGTYLFKGATCTGLLADENIFGSDYAWVPLYQRPGYQLNQAPMVEVPYTIVENPIQWYRE